MMESKESSSLTSVSTSCGTHVEDQVTTLPSQQEREEEKNRKPVDSSTEDDLPQYRDPPPPIISYDFLLH